MSNLSRRQFLVFFGSSAAATALAPNLDRVLFGAADPSVANAVVTGPLSFTPVRLPHPLPAYQSQPSYLATGFNVGTTLPASAAPNLAQFTAVDDVVVPPEYERYVIVKWGDRVFPNNQDYFGYNCDYTGYAPIDDNNVYLVVNHEYVSYPISRFAPEAPADVQSNSFPETGPLVVPGFPTPANSNDVALRGEFMYNQGMSVVRLTRSSQTGRYAAVRDAKNRRVHGLSGLGINSQRTDGYQTITSWGSKSYQTGDQNYLIGTGPAATDVFPLSTDGLGNKIIGTAFNCSGGTTPWGTILSAEENFQGSAGAFFVGVQEDVQPNGTQTSYSTGTTGATFGAVGEKYGWMVEIDPSDSTYRLRKHTALGRFRHENIAMRVETGNKLVAYLGDDRRGGHTWKYVSNGVVGAVNSKSNSQLFESGTLYVARFDANGTGEWLPLVLSAPTNPIKPTDLVSADPQQQRAGATRFPRRAGIAGQTINGGSFIITTANQATTLAGYQGKTLADFYTSQGALLCDSFLAANLIGGTPTARPEDLEVHPVTKEVLIAYTDGAPGGDGYPDSRIFVVGKYTAAVNETQQPGGLYKIVENSADGAGLTFTWSKLEQGGEAGTLSGSGFANVDNLAFDNQANVWGVTDMSTSLHNGFNTGAAGTQQTITHAITGNASNLVGVFGNNWLFYVPTSGVNAGEVIPFASGPVRCEMTGPTFIGDTLIIAIQHPGEDCPYSPQVTLTRTTEMLALDGTLFNQTRVVPRGSNWPSNILGNAGGPPRPSVIGIRRKQSLGNGNFV
jgi:uncharacterized protein